MAKQKLTPRQKMINLMYLVFIAMMALQMSKEVLSAFGMVNEKFESANTAAITSNEELLNGLGTKAEDDPTRFKGPFEIAKKVSGITQEFYAYVNTLKAGITESYESERTADGKLPAERMDKGDLIDAAWFAGDKYSEEGQAFINAIEKYKTDIKGVLSDTKFQPIIIDLDNRFDISDVKDGQGITKPYLNYNFQGFPSIATLTKLSTMQNDAKVLEHEIYNSLLGNTLTQAASMRNYQAFIVSEKSTYFAGESFKGKVVLGRYDKSTVPTKVTVNGQTIDLNKSLSEGQVNLNFNTGNVGEHDIKGMFTFMEEGSPVDIPIKGNYVVVPKPNSANISADKMNVVYRGVANPLTISFAGISDDKVVASAPGLSKAGRVGSYTLNPQAGREVTINVSGTLPDGQRVSDSKVFRIKDIPSPRGTVRGEFAAKGPKSNLEVVTVGAKLEDFDFEVNLTVTGFVLQVPGLPSVVVQGNRMNERAKATIRKAKLGDIVVISDIKVRLEGAGNYALKKTAPCTFEII